MTTVWDFLFFLLAGIAWLLGLIWSWRGTPAPAPGPWGWPLYAGLVLFSIPFITTAGQNLH
jgi:hypothetical protein